MCAPRRARWRTSLSLSLGMMNPARRVFFIKTLLKYHSGELLRAGGSFASLQSPRLNERARRAHNSPFNGPVFLTNFPQTPARALRTTCMEHGAPINLQIRILPYGVADVLHPDRVVLVVDPRQRHPETRGIRSAKHSELLHDGRGGKNETLRKRMDGECTASRADSACSCKSRLFNPRAIA